MSTLNVLQQYIGTGLLAAVYAAAVVYLFLKEKNGTIRLFLIWMPLAVLIVFLLPPFYALYSKAEGAETYYRILWMIPAGVTIAYAGGRIFVLSKNSRLRALTALCLLMAILLPGQMVYVNPNVSAAENRLHLPQSVIDVCDYMVSVSDGSDNIMVAAPQEMVHFIRQYDPRFRLPYGREMLVSSWNFENAVYDAMEGQDVINAEKLAEAAKRVPCHYIILNAARPVEGDLTDCGYELLVFLDGYNIYRDPEVSLLWTEYRID